MKTIGLLGGMSWESSVAYYRRMNEAVRARLGGLHSAKCVMYSVDFADIEPLQRAGRWQDAAERLCAAARHVEQGGADFLVLCTNTMHKIADEIQNHLRIPLLHIADATASAVRDQQLQRVGLLGTKFTMEDNFYRERLTRKHGLEVVVPGEEERQTVHRVIYQELCLGRVEPQSKAQYVAIIDRLARQGAEGVILGCTEIGLLINQRDCSLPVFDTTRIHAEAAVEYALHNS